MRPKIRYIHLGLCFGICSTVAHADHPTIAFGSESAGAINTISATPLPVGAWGFGLRSEIITNDEFSTEQLQNFAASGQEGVHSTDQITSTSLSLSYGITEDLSLSLRLPYIQRKNIRESELEDGVPEAHTLGDSSGVGDLLLLGQYRVLARKDTDVSILFGIKVPTGETREKDNGGIRFETEFQPGTGSWDFLLGAAISKNVGQMSYHANILYNKTTPGSQSTKLGDAFSYNVGLSYRLNEPHDTQDHDHRHESISATLHSAFNWDLSLELNGETRRPDKIFGISEINSGATTVFLSPGVRVSAGKFSGFISYGLPLVENQKGQQTDISNRIVAGLSIAL